MKKTRRHKVFLRNGESFTFWETFGFCAKNSFERARKRKRVFWMPEIEPGFIVRISEVVAIDTWIES